MNINSKDGQYSKLECRDPKDSTPKVGGFSFKPKNKINAEENKKDNMNFSMFDPKLNHTLLDKTLHDDSYEKFDETIIGHFEKPKPEELQPNDIPLYDKITLGPIEKYQKWNRYPKKMLIHMMLIFLTSLQVLVTIRSDTNYSRTHSLVLDRLFLTPEGESDDLSDRRSRNIFTINELTNFVNQSVFNYYHLNDFTLEKYDYLRNQKDEIKGVDVDIQYSKLSSPLWIWKNLGLWKFYVKNYAF